MLVKAYAKINWALNVTGTREDGYHLLDMLVQRIELCDDISISPCDEMVFESDDPGLAMDERNLVVRAAYALKNACAVSQNAHIRLNKRIPSQAGLGGGSADAAATLMGLNEFWKTGLSIEQLAEIGVKLGADVPLCLYPGLMRVSGIGEVIEEAKCEESLPLLIIQPDAGLSTAEIFKRYDLCADQKHANIDEAVMAYSQRNYQRLFASCHNQLQRTAAEMLPEIASCVGALYQKGADFAQMTGSGSCVFGVFLEEEKALLAKEALKDIYPVCILTKTRCR
ncbi:MAG: 4-(cytidine 5'-diphospho)-2-C-methyl-D-erythritol kinase [Bacillota bacterium]|nr:4-(cytidine 5'-diphospho)-2-C-methyl-D-erythritol kinase [Bacillota bacterium]